MKIYVCRPPHIPFHPPSYIDQFPPAISLLSPSITFMIHPRLPSQDFRSINGCGALIRRSKFRLTIKKKEDLRAPPPTVILIPTSSPSPPAVKHRSVCVRVMRSPPKRNAEAIAGLISPAMMGDLKLALTSTPLIAEETRTEPRA